ncbi:uncharacterized protein LOC128951935 [Oppia nitens]|uniref:uncharacterized protein LOC128951935 n=1 Tax=Oppia nitens TaxID=1686743 RepID=UPI0023D9AD5F|nr:uncharacterized protein LOC128951935 [Oppia nitens]
MNFVVNICCLLAIGSIIGLVSSLSIYERLYADIDALDSPIENCLLKINLTAVYCVLNALSDWGIPIDKPIDSKSRKGCCAAYEVFDCLIEAADQLCTTDESQVFDKFIRDAIVDEQRVNCTAYPYHSEICSLNATIIDLN